MERCKPLPPFSDKSDHDIVLYDIVLYDMALYDMALQAVRARLKRKTIFFWKESIKGIKQALLNYSLSFVNKFFSSVDDTWQDIKSVINSVTDQFVPTRRARARSSHPWFDSHLRKLTKRKHQAYAKARRTGHPRDMERYTRQKT